MFALIDIASDPAYPGQWRVNGKYIEQVAKMTHWEYPEAVERFGRQLSALGIAAELERRGAVDGDLVMVDQYDFEFAPGMTNPYIPAELLEQDLLYHNNGNTGGMLVDEPDTPAWTPFRSGGYLEDDAEELVGFNEDEGWDLLDQTEGDLDEFEFSMFVEQDDEVWQS
jgi:GTP-binding protein